MAGDCTYNTHYANDDTFGTIKQSADGQQELVRDVNGVRTAQGSVSSPPSPYFEEIGGSLYRKKLERGFVQYREVLAEEKRLNAIATFHQKRPGRRHHTLEDTYRFVAEHYWWEGMYLQVREYVLGCEECKLRKADRQEGRCVSRMVMSHSQEVLSKLKAQQEAGLFCDITLKTGGGHAFSAHKAVLAAVSEYFQEVFTEMDSAAVPQSYIDLTGFSEESFMPLLEFSYTSTLTLKLENLPEVSTMARHLRMWPALEACKAIQRENGSPGAVHRAGLPLSLAPGCPPLELPNSRRTFPSFAQRADAFQWKRKRELSSEENDGDDHHHHHHHHHHAGPLRNCAAQCREHNADGNFKLTLDDSDESEGECSRWPGLSQPQHRLQSSHPQPEENGFPCSPTRRLKLMDFKSPSSKRKLSTCSLSPTPGSASSSFAAKRTSPPQPRAVRGQPARLLRSTPGAALALRRLLPKLDISFKGKRRRLGSSFCSSSTATASSKGLSHRHSSPPEIQAAEVDQSQVTGLVTPTKVKQEPVEEEVQGARVQEEVLSPRTQEKYRLLSVLGLQRKSLLPGPDALTGWKQKNRLRKPKVNNYSLTARRKPKAQGSDLAPGAMAGGIGSSIGVLAEINPTFSLCDMTRVELLRRVIKAEPPELIRPENMKLKKKVAVHDNKPLLSTVKNTRSKVTLPPLLPTPCKRPEDRVPQEYRRSREMPRAQAKSAKWPPGAPKKPAVKVKQEPVDCPVFAHTVHVPHRNSSHVRQRVSLTPPPRAKKSALSDGVVHTRSSGMTGRTQRYNSRCLAVQQSRQKCSTGPSDKSGLQRGKVKRRLREMGKGEESQEWGQHHSLHQHPQYKAIKEEPADPLPLSVPLPDQETPELGKRQSKLPVKLLDPGFLISFCRPAAGIKREEESVDICLTRSVAHGTVPPGSPAHGSVLSAGRLRRRDVADRRGVEMRPRLRRERQATQAVAVFQRNTKALRRKVKKEPAERSASQRVTQGHSRPPATKKRSDTKREPTKNLAKLLPLHSRRSILLESIRRARLKQLRGPSAQAPRGSHACQQCRASYRDCDALIMHRIRHIEGKHWPCPLCSKTFFSQKNVKNHIRNHDPKLYRCRQCMVAMS
ncbi:uncharacterized protein si:dkey-229b18.3 [Alosa sapidissima]|uniref:uncharacterized protein si:dkey-229b18.3 n=1 Tax=Alosa sapidissima TaxID=34773 RepID=UPI001C09EA30|nr:uncharacterized protein si:dkey-229b18.3 [Alosa sapidissima]